MAHNQFGIKLVDSREPIWVVTEHATVIDFCVTLASSPGGMVVKVVHEDNPIAIFAQGVAAICGPNSPRVFDVFKR